MGRSAKFHKRSKSITIAKSSHQPNSKVASAAPAPQEQRKKAGLKAKATKRKDGEGHVLGGADYVELMMGGRRKAKEEATKLPPKED
ncbi:hypothetical protein ABKN59_010340 [Abortiporus biennis]